MTIPKYKNILTKIGLEAEPAVPVLATQSLEQPAPKLASSALSPIFVRMFLYFGMVNNGLETT